MFILLFINLLFKFDLLFFKKKLNESRFSPVEIESILNKVKNNQPLIYASKINKNIIESAGISLTKAIFVERAELLSINYAKSLWLAKQIYDFNLIIFYQTESSIEKFKNFFKNKVKFFNIADLSKSLKENLLKLNINHNEKNKLDLKTENMISLKGNFQKSTIFKNYYLEQSFYNSDSNLNIKQTFHEGQYSFFNVSFFTSKSLQIEYLKNFQLKHFDYLTLQKEKNLLQIKSIINNFEYYFYSSIKINKIFLNKIKNLNCYNLKCKIELKLSKKEQKSFWFYFGKNPPTTALNLNSDEIQNISSEQVYFKILKKIEKRYNIKIISSDSVLNYYYNKYLPEKIILEGIKTNVQIDNYINFKNFNSNKILKYSNDCLKTITFKQLISMYKSKQFSAFVIYKLMSDKLLLQKNDFIFINKTELKNYELKLFFENKTKSIIVKSDVEKKLIIDDISYYNCQNISLKTLKDYDFFEIRI